MRRKALALLALGSLVVAASAYGGSLLASAATVNVVAGKPSELRFTLSKRTVPRGAVTFKVVNRGSSTHDFRIAGKKTAMLAPGRSATLRVALRRAGRYPFLCTVPGHAAAGMKGVLTVR